MAAKASGTTVSIIFFFMISSVVSLGWRRLSDVLSQSRLAISASLSNTVGKTFYCSAVEGKSMLAHRTFALKASAIVHVMELKTAVVLNFWAAIYADIV
jgi:hypothetical protein